MKVPISHLHVADPFLFRGRPAALPLIMCRLFPRAEVDLDGLPRSALVGGVEYGLQRGKSKLGDDHTDEAR